MRLEWHQSLRSLSRRGSRGTVVPDLVLIEDSTCPLIGHVRSPYRSDAKAVLVRERKDFVPYRLIHLLYRLAVNWIKGLVAGNESTHLWHTTAAGGDNGDITFLWRRIV